MDYEEEILYTHVAGALGYIKRNYDSEILSDREQFLAAFAQIAPTLQREKKFLRLAFEEGIVEMYQKAAARELSESRLKDTYETAVQKLEAEAGLTESNAEMIVGWIAPFYEKSSKKAKSNGLVFYGAVITTLLAVITFFLKWFALGGAAAAFNDSSASSSLAGLLVFAFGLAANYHSVSGALAAAMETQPLVGHYFILLCVVIGLFIGLGLASLGCFIRFYVQLFRNRFDSNAGTACAFLAAFLGILALSARIVFAFAVNRAAGLDSFFMITPMPLVTLALGIISLIFIGKYKDDHYRGTALIDIEKPEMNNSLFITMSLAILALPATLLAVYGEPLQTFAGEADYQRPAYSGAAFRDGTFQEDFDNWFSTKYPLRQAMVEAYGALEARAAAMSLDFTLPEPAREEQGYRGNDQVVVGKDGYLYENGYINEYYGFAGRYTETSDGQLAARAAALRGIQEELAGRGVAFLVVITPSKAANLPQYIPEWYLARHTAAPDYVRPYQRFLALLAGEGVFFVDSARVYEAAGLTEIFPKTGTHWTKPAAFATVRALIAAYESQTGTPIRNLAYDSIRQSPDPPGFGSSEQDIFGVAYAGRSNERAKAIVDSAYPYPNVYIVGEDQPGIPHMLIQGGSFNDDIVYYLREYGIVSSVTEFRYNNSENVAIDWAPLLEQTDFVVLEVNEQFVYNMGGSAPVWGLGDFLAYEPGENIIDALYEFLSK
ncbi:MAG: hypothetical protein LBI54_02520 [Lachnospiraceae bacterium]|jgi:hypothetical protein|nr:hypothetical protein [Lachnospiraceae bacterium]